MQKVGITNLQMAIVALLAIIPDVREAKESGDKITWVEGGILAIKHGGKAVSIVSTIDEIGLEVIDIDSEESEAIFDQLKDLFGGSDIAKEAIKKIIVGAAGVSQGVQELILELKK